MPTKIYIAVNGTCTAGPDDNLMDIIKDIGLGKRKREFSEKLGRDVSGGSTVLWIKSPSGIYMIDTGDYDDRSILEKSLEKIAKEESKKNIDAKKSVERIYHSHAHLDHVGNNDLFMGAKWMIDGRDRLAEVALGPDDSEEYNGFRAFYDGHRQRGITSDKFTRYHNNKHTGKPKELTIKDATGHDIANKFFIIKDDDIAIINLETREEHKTDRIVFTGDAICDERYLKRAMHNDMDVKKTSVYGTKIPNEQWWINDPVDRVWYDAMAYGSNMKIIEEAKKGGLMIFGHGGVYDINAAR